MWVMYVWVAPRIIRAEFKEVFNMKDDTWLNNFIVVYHKSEKPDSSWEYQYTIGLYKQMVWLPVVGPERLNEALEFVKNNENVSIINWDKD